MLAKDLARAIEKHKGIVFVQTNWTSKTWIQVVKKDIVEHFKRKGCDETNLLLNVYSTRAYVDGDYELIHKIMDEEFAERKRNGY